MGVDITAYTVYGVKIDYYSDFCDAYYEDDDVNCEMQEYVVADGMGGQYIVLGAKLFHGCAYDDEGFEIINISALQEKKEEVILAFKKHMPEYVHLLDGEWQILAFMRYS